MESNVVNVDCMDFMKDLPDKFFDLAVVDPDYGLGEKITSGGTWSAKYKKGQGFLGGLPSDAYFNELFRVSKNQIVWGGNYFGMPPTRCFIVWRKKTISEDFSMAMCEYAWTSFYENAKYFESLPCKGNRFHPAQKPIKLYKWLLENYATCKKCHNSGVIQEAIAEKWMGTVTVDCEYCEVAINGKPKIFDSHMGSQSSRIAAYDLGFDYWGCELDKDYFEAGNKRFANFKSQLKMFT